MSDKSFGDHTSRNIVKNPLLSSAVTGLSLEDLTHKAVLLPVSPSLDQISRPDQQQGTQARTLAHPHHDTPVFPAGDALSNVPLSNTPQTTKQNVLDSKNNVKLEENRNTQGTTVSKASAKSDDDFDVNEYIARLQGSRYVSAPLHSHMKDDQNANLEATEENLEEINLNETAPVETQQSLTADIAQNFSQLPTVLPHVASAVFSSFSNMLNYKNREPTLDRTNVQTEQKKSGYDDVQFQRPPDVGVPLMGVEECKAPKEVAPPPKELPTGGASNFRITTKKKYAQIPGLSSGDAAQSMTYMPGQGLPPMGQNMPPMAHNMPFVGQNMPPTVQSMPPMSQSIPPTGQSMPLMSQSIPPMGQSMPPTGQSIPFMGISPTSHGLPPMGPNMPPSRQSMPPMSQYLPSTSQSLSNMGQSMIPLGQNLPPMSQNTQPMSQVMPQSNLNMGHGQMPLTSQNLSSFQTSHISQEQSMITQSVSPARQSASNLDQNAPSIGQNVHFSQTTPSVGQNVSIFDPSIVTANPPANEGIKSEAITQAVTVSQTQYNIFNPAVENQGENKPSEMQFNLYREQSSNFFTPVENKEQNAPAAAIIPPPPMFSNAQKRDSQTSVGKSILPPSVARRISANQPLIKPTTSTPSFMENIFVPAPVSDTTVTTQADISFSSASSAFVPTYGSSNKSVTQSMVPPPSQMNVSSHVPSSFTTLVTCFTPPSDKKPINEPSAVEKTPIPGVDSSSLPISANMAPSQLPFGSTPINAPPMPPTSVLSPAPPGSTNMPMSPPSQALFGSTPTNVPSNYLPTSVFTPGPPTSANMTMSPPSLPTSVFAPGPVESTQNIPPPMFQPTQNVPNYNPQETSTHVSHPITQMPPSAIEPPKPVPEPPKASGGVNFRMTKKRPQYYAGPIEGVGDISNNVKPVLAPVIPSPPDGSHFQGAVFTPSQHVVQPTEFAPLTVANLDQASVPFDMSKPVEPVGTYASFGINEPQEQSYGTSFNMGHSESQNYTQEYNTPFDTSRDLNDPYNEPRQESKGFGIIGSLKSKLSSIDINKIQNTVTTFFDPAYNDIKVADPVPQDNAPYQQQQYGQSQQGQSNFDIFVPSLEYNQHQHSNFGDTSHGNEYYQTQNLFKESQSLDLSSYSTSSFFTDPNYSTEQIYSSNPLYDSTQPTYQATSYKPQENIPENVEKLSTDNLNTSNTTFYNPKAFNQDNLTQSSVQPSPYEITTEKDNVQSNNAQMSQQNVNYFNPDLQPTSNFATPPQPKQKDQEYKRATVDSGESLSNMTYYNPNAYENRQIWEPQETQNNSAILTQPSYEDSQKHIISAVKEEEPVSMFYNPDAFVSENQQIQAQNPPSTCAKNIKGSSLPDIDATTYSSGMISDTQYNSESTCDSALNTTKYNISNINNQSEQPKEPSIIPPAASFFDNPLSTPPQLFNPPETDLTSPHVPIMKTEELIVQHTPTVTPLPIGTRSQTDKSKVGCDSKNKVGTEKTEKTLIESVSKQEIPIVGVSTVPLFGLSTMIADKSQDTSQPGFQTKELPIDTILQSQILFEENTASGFFENVKPDNKIISENQAMTSPLGLSLSIDDVKNVLVIEPPRENIGALLKRNASSSKLENLPPVLTPENHFKQIDDITNIAYQESSSQSFFRHSDNFPVEQTDSPKITGIVLDDNSELNICETCREVDTPEHDQKHEKTEDLTTQLIENITSRVQLSNPLTVPLSEDNAPVDKISKYDQNLDEINQVAEETFEILQVQSATELLDEPAARTYSEIRDYGWVTQEVVDPKPPPIDHDYACKIDSDSSLAAHDGYGIELGPVPASNLGMDCEFKIDPSSIGFLGNTSLPSDNVPVPNNASDEIKAEIKHSHEDIVLPRQMSMPTAPPEEDLDPKLDEPGVLDVHSIEQDAKKDFPIEEEFVIEPDEFLSTDDDKIESRERKRSSEDSGSNDTFTNRIDKFKKKSDNDGSEQSEQKPYISPPISMASYFDTGNYAVESHYRNSFISMRIPPGFEEEFARKLSRVSLGSDKTPEPCIPETSTQTRPSNTCTYISASDGHDNIIGFEMKAKENFESFAQAYAESKAEENVESLTVSEDKKLASMFGDTSLKPEIFTPFSDNKTQKREPVQANINPIADVIQPISAFADTNLDQPQVTQNVPVQTTVEPKSVTQSSSESNSSTQNVQQLSDPINFFSTNEEEAKPEEPAAAEGFSRLASYFSMPPPQPDHSKSFFELSQSQNHYRHVLKTEKDKPVQRVFSTKTSHIDDDTKNNIKELMKDLTSPQNVEPNNVRIVNYFTVELDQDVNKRTTHASPINVQIFDENLSVNNQNEFEKNIEIKDNGTTENNNIQKDDIELVKDCKYCLRHIPGIDNQNFVVKSTVNGKSEAKRNDSKMAKKTVASDSKKSSVNFAADYDVEKQAEDNVLVVSENRGESEYSPVKHHWFYRVDVEDKSVWRGFSTIDSDALEDAFHSRDLNENTVVATDGGRYDVNIVGRLRIAVYWKQKPTNVRRCSWFYKGTTDARYVPYTEAVAEKLEEEYRHGITTGEWHRKLVLPNSEMVIMHGPSVMVHFLNSGAADAFTTPPTLLGKTVYRNPLKLRVARDQKQKIDHLILLVHGAGEFKRKLQVELDLGLGQATTRPRVVRRSHEESEIEESEPSRIDHLLLLCHGVGSACDMRFRSVEEVVEDFRTTSLQLLQSHYKNSYDNGVVSRVEVLPISWHEQLHSGETGVDKRLACVTLDSIPRLRAFTNHTVLDVLFYTSPVFHQTIIDTVCFELNRVYRMFRERNPLFQGEVSLGGHSLGSVILYDLLCNQIPQSLTDSNTVTSSQKSYVSETAASGQLATKYPQLHFPPAALYALGSPIAIFECIRGVQSLGHEFALPTCKHFFNIFHPYDPIAYRIEPLIDPQLQEVKPSQIPHHKGRKRMHLELKDTMARVGADLKQKLLESLRSTWNKWTSTPPTDAQLEKVVEEEMEKEQLCDENNEPVSEVQASPEMLGRLNCGRRVDYVLQEAPLEMINEYLFAMSSHVGYWESEDTMLLMLREIYSALGVQPDCTVPQQNMTVTKIVAQDENSPIHETSEIPSTSRG